MLEALWSVTFQSNVPIQNNAGGGVAVLETGRVLGGDAQFTYIGSYRSPRPELIEAEIECVSYREGGVSIFGPLKKFHLKLQGKPDRNRFLLRGVVVEQPQMQIAIELVRRAELP